jgi:hypothetical protein
MLTSLFIFSLVIAPMLALVVEDTAAAAVADFLPLRARSVTVAAKLATLHVPAPKLLATLATVEVEVEAMARSAAVAAAVARLGTSHSYSTNLDVR